ncbi:putative transcriptional regulator, PucR family [Kribbella flavida DSM 17836]|uniref:Putative transcriptional regulator, PucR family n=1 Tax=Kribbella flavida (strain DSM 17836 / JCM 10339 / NBRC 14399) TaxID=479435 RepID=D2PWG9_KRIFD|nr:PucR family transcriptional regulator [Kribbella flavida]ADB31621.1 putative transcriptional regulator, PucR family [Kribbella flavida DSM 17836]
MITAPDLVVAVGPALFETVVTGRGDGEVRDVFLADPQEPATGQPGDLVLGLGLRNAEEAVELLERCAAGNASGVVLRTGLAQEPAVVATAERWLVTLIALQPSVSWAHVVWLLRGVIDRAAAPDSPVAGDAGVHQELFALADAAAAIVDAPVTIEDNQSRVLAYSSQQDLSDTDPTRVSTIVGRRVPAEVIAHFRARGIFRRLARSSEPFLVPDGPNGIRPRLVVPVRAGGEWLGSIWAVVDGPVSDAVTEELSNAASVLALHLLRLRAQADVARRSAIDRLRTVLRQFSPEAPVEVRLPPPPWRVVALSSPDAYDVPQQLDLWESTGRRHGWSEPLLADLDGTVLAVVSDGEQIPGSWRWLRKLVADQAKDSPGTAAAAGGRARYPADLPSSRAEAVELLGLVRRGLAPGPALRVEQAWHVLTVHRAVTSLDTTKLDGPLATLLRYDIENDTSFVDTLQAWLNHPGQPQQAAKELHLHTNTLRHRMKRIGEIARLDLSDPRERLALQLQIAAVRTEH